MGVRLFILLPTGVGQGTRAHKTSGNRAYPSPAIKTIVRLPCKHRSQCGPCYTTSPHKLTYVPRTLQTLLYYIKILYESIGGMFCGVSVLTVTAISVDRLLALMLGLRYRQEVTLKRVWVIAVTSWLLALLLNYRMATDTVVLYGNLNVLLLQNLS